MKQAEFEELRETVVQVLQDARQRPELLDGTTIVKLAKGCRKLMKEREAVQKLGEIGQRELEHLTRISAELENFAQKFDAWSAAANQLADV